MAALRKWWPDADPWPLEEMYFESSLDDKTPCWRGKRGSSSLESFRAHISRMLGGHNYSPAMTRALVLLRILMWNAQIRMGVCKESRAYVASNVKLLSDLAATCDAQGWPHKAFAMPLADAGEDVLRQVVDTAAVGHMGESQGDFLM